MSCPAIGASNTDRNVDTVNYPKEIFRGVWAPNFPITHSAFPYVDPREARIMPPQVIQPYEVEKPQFNMRYSYGCTNCIRNRIVIFSP